MSRQRNHRYMTTNKVYNKKQWSWEWKTRKIRKGWKLWIFFLSQAYFLPILFSPHIQWRDFFFVIFRYLYRYRCLLVYVGCRLYFMSVRGQKEDSTAWNIKLVIKMKKYTHTHHTHSNLQNILSQNIGVGRTIEQIACVKTKQSVCIPPNGMNK